MPASLECKACDASKGYVLVCQKGDKGAGNSCIKHGAVGCAKVVKKAPPPLPHNSSNHTYVVGEHWT